MSENNKRVIVFDGVSTVGGNQRYSIILLAAIQAKIPEFWESIHCFSGVSAGSMAALPLAHSSEPGKGLLMAWEIANSKVVYDLDLFRTIGFFMGLNALFPTQNVRNLLEPLGDMRLKDLHKDVVIGTCNLKGETVRTNTHVAKPRMLRNFGDDADNDMKAMDAALMSGSLPIMFPVFNTSADGAFNAFNPSMLTMSEIFAHDPLFQNDSNKIKDLSHLKHLDILSLGTRWPPFSVDSDSYTLDWGYFKWMLEDLFTKALPFPRVMDLFFQANYSTVDFECQNLIDDHYLRIQPTREGGKDSILDDFNESLMRKKPEDREQLIVEGSLGVLLQLLDDNKQFDRVLDWIRNIWLPDH